jgi:hypothetical protein
MDLDQLPILAFAAMFALVVIGLVSMFQPG